MTENSSASVAVVGFAIATSKTCIHANAHALARYASLCQENDIVPIVEPEILMDVDHTIETCYEITNTTLEVVFKALTLFKVNLKAIVLKPNMILPGIQSNKKISNNTIAKMTFDVLKNNVPPEVPGIAFLSGGQTSDLAAERLNTLNKLYIEDRPWKLTFSYGRALQQDALLNWAKGKKKEVQDALMYRAKMNHLASIGKL